MKRWQDKRSISYHRYAVHVIILCITVGCARAYGTSLAHGYNPPRLRRLSVGAEGLHRWQRQLLHTRSCNINRCGIAIFVFWAPNSTAPSNVLPPMKHIGFRELCWQGRDGLATPYSATDIDQWVKRMVNLREGIRRNGEL